jgi:cyclic pyranopterin phosphate synthase
VSDLLVDGCARPVTYLRISVTDRCNFSCCYCTPSKPNPRLSHEDILRFEEILTIARIGLDLGIRKIRITGGEPLVRKGLLPFLRTLGQLPGLERLALTTNGMLLEDALPFLREAGVHQINLSLDTLDPEKFRKITGKDAFHVVWRALTAALDTEAFTLKLNAVALRGVNEADLLPLALLAQKWPISVRFIEEMPIGHAQKKTGSPLLVPEIQKHLMPLGPLTPLASGFTDGPAQRFTFPGAKGEIGFIPALSRHFCKTCNRLRLTANGRLRPCLLSDASTDIRTALRQHEDENTLKALFHKSLRHKGAEHVFEPGGTGQVDTAMARIGG